MEHAPKLRIAIVGGGIAGLCTALALQNHQEKHGANIEFTVFEQSAKYSEIGAGVGFNLPALKALHSMGEGVSAAVTKVTKNDEADPDTWITFRIGEDGHPNCLEEITTITGEKSGAGSCHRADFLDSVSCLLREGATCFGARCSGYKQTEDGITLKFDNRPDETFDVVIACDGVKSKMRKCLYERKGLDVEKQVARYSKWVVWRGLLPIEAFEDAMGKASKRAQLLCGQDRHLLVFPIRGGKLINVVGFVLDEKEKKLGSHTGPWQEPRPKSEMLEDFATFSEPCKKVLQAIEKPSVWGIFATPELEVATDDRLALIGDAGHAMTPHQGSGGSQAVEDAVFLAALLCNPKVAEAPVNQRGSRVKRVMEEFQTVRHERASKVQRTSHEAGMLYEFRGVKGEGNSVDKIRSSLENRMKWIWQYDLPSAIDECIARL